VRINKQSQDDIAFVIRCDRSRPAVHNFLWMSRDAASFSAWNRACSAAVVWPERTTMPLLMYFPFIVWSGIWMHMCEPQPVKVKVKKKNR
jgi:hypothetical protein